MSSTLYQTQLTESIHSAKNCLGDLLAGLPDWDDLTFSVGNSTARSPSTRKGDSPTFQRLLDQILQCNSGA